MPPELLPPRLAEWLAGRQERRFDAGQSLIAPDQPPSHVWYLRSGLVRIYSLDADGDAYNHEFRGSGEWAFGQVLWRGGQVCCSETAIGVEAVQATRAVSVPMAELERWQQSDPEVAAYLIEALLRMTAAGMQREAGLVQRSAEQRYRELLQKQPQIIDAVPLRQIAAWLGITPVALSRIRRRMAATGSQAPNGRRTR
jgi:CRP-like cAMP-binding protein